MRAEWPCVFAKGHAASARRVPVDLDELINAFGTHLPEVRYYLDLETGDVIPVTDEARGIAQDLAQSVPEGQGVTHEAVRSAAERFDEPDWMLQGAIRAAQIEQDRGTRYVEVPSDDSRTGYRDMEDFIATVTDPALQRSLERAIIGRGTFRRFRDLLADYPVERERWFAFEADARRRRVLAWLDVQGIEPVPRPTPPHR